MYTAHTPFTHPEMRSMSLNNVYDCSLYYFAKKKKTPTEIWCFSQNANIKVDIKIGDV
jgi:hypothetical protein